MFGIMEALLSFIRRQVGLRTDAADSAGSVHAKIGNLLSVLDCTQKVVIASDNLKQSADTESSLTSSSDPAAALKKKFKVYVSGIVRISFEIKLSTDGGSYKHINAQGYVNGIAVSGTAQNSSGSYVKYTYDIPVEVGNTVELWISLTTNGSSTTGYWRNFRVYWDISDVLATVLLDT